MQDCSNSIANALELLLSCTKPSITPCALMIPIVQYHYTLCRGFPFNRASHGSHRSTNQWIHCQIIGCLSTKVRSQINHTVYIHVAKYMTPAHDDVMKWKYFPRYWSFVRSQVNSPHKGRWHGALMFSLICAWINGWVNNGEAGDLRRHRAHYDVMVMSRGQVYDPGLISQNIFLTVKNTVLCFNSIPP